MDTYVHYQLCTTPTSAGIEDSLLPKNSHSLTKLRTYKKHTKSMCSSKCEHVGKNFFGFAHSGGHCSNPEDYAALQVPKHMGGMLAIRKTENYTLANLPQEAAPLDHCTWLLQRRRYSTPGLFGGCCGSCHPLHRFVLNPRQVGKI